MKELGKDKPKLSLVLPEYQSLPRNSAKRDSSIVKDKNAAETVSSILSTTTRAQNILAQRKLNNNMKPGINTLKMLKINLVTKNGPTQYRTIIIT